MGVGYRVADGVYWAESCARPAAIPLAKRVRGRKRAGISYEKEFAAALPPGLYGQWWEFRDNNGHGWCQTDVVLDARDALVVMECKYTWTREALGQIGRLYKPVLERATQRPVVGIVVCKVLTDEAQNICGNLGTALALALAGRTPTLHWLPKTPLVVKGGALVSAHGLGVARAKNVA